MTDVLTVERLCKRFGGIVVADNVALSMQAGHVLGLIGPNGAGKSSLFNLVAGVVRADRGVIRLNGVRIDTLSTPRRARLGLSRTWQHVRLFASLNVLDNLLIAPRIFPDQTPFGFFNPHHSDEQKAVRERAYACLEMVRMADAANKMPAELSYGKQKLVGIARALMNDGNCLLLDEPMAGVEGPAYAAIQDVIRKEAASGRAICIVEHNISFVRDLCHEAIFMFNGRVVTRGCIDDLIRDPDLTELYFGT